MKTLKVEWTREVPKEPGLYLRKTFDGSILTSCVVKARNRFLISDYPRSNWVAENKGKKPLHWFSQRIEEAHPGAHNPGTKRR